MLEHGGVYPAAAPTRSPRPISNAQPKKSGAQRPHPLTQKVTYRKNSGYQAFFLRRAAIPASPSPSNDIVIGSGTSVPLLFPLLPPLLFGGVNLCR